ncbi:MAG: Hsp70 family protein, partial [Desulfobacterales bacterium]|nr:Hsp70 family protein [Desulfobacterales bacterium]
SQEEIDQLVKDAEMHAEEDKQKRELVEARNSADALIYSTEKSIKDLGDKVDSDTKTKVEESIATLRKAMEGEDAAEITRVSEELTQASHKLAEAMYQQASQKEQQAGAGAESSEQAAGGAGAADEDVVDADFEEVKDEDKK